MLGCIRNDLTPHFANIVYVSFIRPILEYCDTVWDRCGAGNALSLEKFNGVLLGLCPEYLRVIKQ
jgi:ATP phosphoribosyltransferase regulatory subunit HisZ